MDEQVAWHVELAVKPGALEAFRALTDEMVEATRGHTHEAKTGSASIGKQNRSLLTVLRWVA